MSGSVCETRISFRDKTQAKRVLNSILPDLEKDKKNRATTELSVKNNELVVKIQSKDTIALRAGINSILRVVSVLEKDL